MKNERRYEKMKHFVLVMFVLFVSFSLASAATLVKNIPLNNVADNGASGRLTVRESISHSGVHTQSLQLKVSGLLPQEGMIYEVWLVDNQTGDYNGLGRIKTSRGGRGVFTFTFKDLNLNNYDKVLITLEPQVDFNPLPNMHILEAMLPDLESAMVDMKANLRGIYQVPKVITPAKGSGMFTLDAKNNLLYYDISFAGLEGNETMVHIHGFASKGQNAGVLFTLPIGNHITGVWNYAANNSEDIESNILAGKTYVNVHTTEYPVGEIRGQIVLDP